MSIHYVLAHPAEESLARRAPKCITRRKKDESSKQSAGVTPVPAIEPNRAYPKLFRAGIYAISPKVARD